METTSMPKQEEARSEAIKPAAAVQPVQSAPAPAKPTAKPDSTPAPQPPAKAPQQMDLPNGKGGFTTVFSSSSSAEEDDMRIPAYMRQKPKK